MNQLNIHQVNQRTARVVSRSGLPVLSQLCTFSALGHAEYMVYQLQGTIHEKSK
jgi:hypothetical protein